MSLVREDADKLLWIKREKKVFHVNLEEHQILDTLCNLVCSLIDKNAACGR